MATRKKRANGTGSIVKLREGLYQGRVTTGRDGSGRQVRKAFYGRTIAEVQARLVEAQAGHQSGAVVMTAGRGPTLDQFAREWLTGLDHRVSAKTATTYRLLIERHVLPHLGPTLLSKITPSHVDRLLSQKVKDGLSTQTVAHIRAVLRTCINAAVRRGVVARNIVSLTYAPRVARAEMATLTREQARLLIESADEHHDGPIWILILATGLRQGEALGIKWADFDAGSQTLAVRRALHRLDGTYRLEETKTRGSVRTLHLPPIAIEVLVKRRTAQGADQMAAGRKWSNEWDLIFTTKRGHPVNGTAITHRFHRHMESHGLPSIRIHDLRHAAASFMLAEGIPVKEVQEALGHSSATTTLDRYGHVLAAGRAGAAAAMDRILRGE